MNPISNIYAAVLACVAMAGLSAAAEPNIRIAVQLIEVAHPTLTDLLAGKGISGDKLHTQAMALVGTGKAKVLETSILTCPDRQKATVESIREVTYHTEYEGGGLGSRTPPRMDPAVISPPLIRPDFFVGWETRNAGVTIEVEPSLAPDGKTVALRFVSEIVDPAGLVTWLEYVDEWGDCSTRLPTFVTLRTHTSITLAPGIFELTAVLTPNPTAPPTTAALRKILVFVRADLPQQRAR